MLFCGVEWEQGAMWNLASHWTAQTFPVLNNFLQTHDSQDTVLIHSYDFVLPQDMGTQSPCATRHVEALDWALMMQWL